MKHLKQKLIAGVAGAILALSLTFPAAAATEVLTVGGRNIWHEAKTQMVEGTTYGSIRTLASYLLPGAEVSWEGGTAWVRGEGFTISARPGEDYMTINGRTVRLTYGVRVNSGSVLVPVRALAENLGYTVEWSRQAGVTVTRETWSPSYTEDELYWLSRIIHAESGGEPFQGKLAVGTVVLNRVASPDFPNTIYGVIFDRKWGIQFTPAYNGMIYKTPSEESVLAAKMVLEGTREAGDSLYFLAPHLTDNHWIIKNREYVTTIGGHWFYR